MQQFSNMLKVTMIIVTTEKMSVKNARHSQNTRHIIITINTLITGK